jgi:hypothetical protein
MSGSIYCLCVLTCVSIIAIGQTIAYGHFAFNNPDLKINKGHHCWVEPHSNVPLAIGAPHSKHAVDATESLMTVMKWQFGLNALACSLLLFIFVMGIAIRYCDNCFPDRENWNPA